MELRDKKRGVKRFINSFNYSKDGLIYAYKNEQSMLIHCIVSIIIIILGLFFKINLTEWLIIFILIGVVMAMELMNTAIEAVVDMVMPDINPLAKIAKDTASAAVFVLSALGFIIGLIIFIPNILKYLN